MLFVELVIHCKMNNAIMVVLLVTVVMHVKFKKEINVQILYFQ